MLFHAALCPGLPGEATPIGSLPPDFSFGSVTGSPAGDRGGPRSVYGILSSLLAESPQAGYFL